MNNKEGVLTLLGLLCLVGFLLVTFWYHKLFFFMHRGPVNIDISVGTYWITNLILTTLAGSFFLVRTPLVGSFLGFLFGVFAQCCYIQYLSWVDETSMVEMLLPSLLPFVIVRLLQFYLERKMRERKRD